MTRMQATRIKTDYNESFCFTWFLVNLSLPLDGFWSKLPLKNLFLNAIKQFPDICKLALNGANHN